MRTEDIIGLAVVYIFIGILSALTAEHLYRYKLPEGGASAVFFLWPLLMTVLVIKGLVIFAIGLFNGFVSMIEGAVVLISYIIRGRK
jgi:hypothetical protein